MPNQQSAVLYVRKSTESDDRQVLSIDAQIDELVSYAARAGLTITRIYRESQSAKAPGRPVFGQVMKEVAAGKVCTLLCWKLDRLARNPIDGGALIWALEQGKLAQIATPQHSFANNANENF